jgi:hypothetical protein
MDEFSPVSVGGMIGVFVALAARAAWQKAASSKPAKAMRFISDDPYVIS